MPPLLLKSVTNVKKCELIQTKWNAIKNTLEVEIFDVWGIDFIGQVPLLFVNQYILVAVDYVSKWVEVTTLHTNDTKVVVKFVKRIIFLDLEPWEKLLLIEESIMWITGSNIY